MSLSNSLLTAVSGLTSSSKRVQTSANNIVNANTPEFKTQRIQTASLVSSSNISGGGGVEAQIVSSEDPVNLVHELTQLIDASASYKANAKLIQTSAELSEDTLDILA
jgi:flagellar basal body rod protein FlgG